MGSLSGKCMCDGMTEWALCLVKIEITVMKTRINVCMNAQLHSSTCTDVYTDIYDIGISV